MKFNNHYDCIILGDHPGALLGASLAGKLGLTVLILNFTSSATKKIFAGGHCFDPESNFIFGLGGIGSTSALVADCLTHLGVAVGQNENIQKESSYFQFLTPERRVDFTSSSEALKFELEREWGTEFSKNLGLIEALKNSELTFQSFWKGLPKRLTLQPKKNKKKAPDLPMDLEDLQGRLEAHSKSIVPRTVRPWFKTGLQFSEFAKTIQLEDFPEFLNRHSLSDVLYLLSMVKTGASFLGGLTDWREFLLDLAQKHGAHVLEKGDCQKIFIEKGHFRGVQVSSWDKKISGGAAILGSSLAHLKNSNVLTLEGKGNLKGLKQGATPVGWRFTLALTVKKTAIPPGMQKRVFWQEDGAPTLEIEVSGLGESRQIFLRTLVPYDQKTLSVSYLRLLASRMMRQLRELMPFVEEHTEWIYPDFRIENGDFLEVYGFVSLDLIPENLRVYKNEGVGIHSGFEGVYLASGESFPGLGSFGGTVAALESVAAITHRLGIAGPMG